jgi:cell wall assembly regulator SMI1
MARGTVPAAVESEQLEIHTTPPTNAMTANAFRARRPSASCENIELEEDDIEAPSADLIRHSLQSHDGQAT